MCSKTAGRGRGSQHRSGSTGSEASDVAYWGSSSGAARSPNLSLFDRLRALSRSKGSPSIVSTTRSILSCVSLAAVSLAATVRFRPLTAAGPVQDNESCFQLMYRCLDELEGRFELPGASWVPADSLLSRKQVAKDDLTKNGAARRDELITATELPGNHVHVESFGAGHTACTIPSSPSLPIRRVSPPEPPWWHIGVLPCMVPSTSRPDVPSPHPTAQHSIPQRNPSRPQF